MTPTIHPDAFYERMKERWKGELGNVYTPKLGMQWADLCFVFNQHIAAHDDPTASERYTVVAAALGAGKTQGMILYCAMLAEAFSDEQQPGVLIVTRRIHDADEIVSTINRLAGRKDFAFAYHSEMVVKLTALSELARYPVLVVTHRGYQLALDKMARKGTGRWPQFSQYREGQRKLNVIDEAIDLVEHDNVTVDALEKTLILIPQSLRTEHASEYKLLQETLEHLKSPEALKVPDGRRGALYEALKNDHADLSALQASIHFTSFKRDWGWTGEEIRERLLATVQAVQRVFAQWSYVMKLPTGEQALHTARLILPRETKGAVILDATAGPNRLYSLFGDRMERRSLPFHTRSYKNVRLHVSRGHRTGKGYIVQNAEEAAKEHIANLQRHLQGHRRVLLITHKDAEAAYVKYSPAHFVTAHWGHIDGSNEWRDADAIAIVSLPRRADWWATSSYFAITGDVKDDFLGTKGDKVRQDIRIGQVLADVAQAIGRTRCRKVVDEEGNCDPVDVYLFVPDNEEGAAIAGGIKAFFHGCQFSEFTTYEGTVTKVKPRASRIEEAFKVALNALPRGTTTAKELRGSALKNCSPRSWAKITSALRDPSTDLYRYMSDLGITFTPGKWRGSPAVLYKA